MLKLGHREGVCRVPNTDKIKARMAEMNITQSDLAKYLGIATPTICQKINNIRPFTLDEAESVAEKLRLNDGDFGAYFFGK